MLTTNRLANSLAKQRTASERLTQLQRMLSNFGHTDSANSHIAAHEDWLKLQLLSSLQSPDIAMDTTKDGQMLLTLAKLLDPQKLFSQ